MPQCGYNIDHSAARLFTAIPGGALSQTPTAHHAAGERGEHMRQIGDVLQTLFSNSAAATIDIVGRNDHVADIDADEELDLLVLQHSRDE
jgi:hypothetical protein